MKKYALALLMLAITLPSFQLTKVYKNKDYRIKQELHFYVPSNTQLS